MAEALKNLDQLFMLPQHMSFHAVAGDAKKQMKRLFEKKKNEFEVIKLSTDYGPKLIEFLRPLAASNEQAKEVILSIQSDLKQFLLKKKNSAEASLRQIGSQDIVICHQLVKELLLTCNNFSLIQQSVPPAFISCTKCVAPEGTIKMQKQIKNLDLLP